MSKIRVLAEEVSNRIAAGEVIERPSSVVKELVDNAVDSGATRIQINIKNGGSSFIQVSDNGSGMDRDDALLCLEAHATSKIQSTDDLEKIDTFGFRGEALPSIASISQFSLLTRQHDSIEGTHVYSDGGTIRSVESTGCPPGTSITVKRLFFNVPARKKFLRTKNTEESHIQETVLLLALSRIDIFVELKFDDRIVFSAPPANDLRTRAALLFGRDTVNEMIPVNFVEAGITITGLIARPGLTRKTRKEQRSFINGRPVDAMSIYQGLRDAYEGMVVKGTYPPALLYLVLDPTRIDINVHPAKKEVRFREARLVKDVVTRAIANSLRSPAEEEDFSDSAPRETEAASTHQNPLSESTQTQEDNDDKASHEPFIKFDSNRRLQSLQKPQSLVRDSLDNTTRKKLDSPQIQTQAFEKSIAPKIPSPLANTNKATSANQPTAPVAAMQKNTLGDLKLLNQFRHDFLLCDGPSGLVIIHIKAALERITFEKMLANMKAETVPSQALLLPITLDLSQADAHIMRKNTDALTNMGFSIEDFGGNSFIISAIPTNFPQDNLFAVFNELLDDLREGHDIKRKRDQYGLLKAVMKSAIRIKQELKREEMLQVISDLRHCQMPYNCPEGRPVMINFSENELLRKFGRK